MIPSYILIRSKRRSLSIQIDASGALIARSPMQMPISAIESFLMTKRDWIAKHQTKRASMPPRPILSEADISESKKKLKSYIIPRVAELWEWKGLPKITSIKITKSERWWGSCSARNGLCFSYRLAEYIGSSFLDAIIIHELAHLREKHHQKSFWDLVYSMMPEYESVMRDRGDIE
jgi:predicted metal-dependent hydrolase